MKKSQLKNYFVLFSLVLFVFMIFLLPESSSQEPESIIINKDSKHEILKNQDGTYTAKLYAYYEPDMADFSVTRDGAILNVSYKGKYLAFEAIPMRNNTEYTWQQVKQAYPNVNFSFVLHELTDRQKYDLNFTNIPSGSQLQLKRADTNIDAGSVSILNRSHIEIGSFAFYFDEECSADINLDRIILNNLTQNCLDPVILLKNGNITQDGHVKKYGTGYSFNDTSTTIQIGMSTSAVRLHRGYIVFNITLIPDTATINQVNLSVFVTAGGADTITIMNITSNGAFVDATTLFNSLGKGVSTPYNSALDWSATGWKNITLGGNANTDLQNRLSTLNNFSIGFNTTEATGTTHVFLSSAQGTANQKPVLTVTYILDTCTYSSGNWNVNCADNCVISSPVNLGGNSISITGTGTFTLNADITNYLQANIIGTDANNKCIVFCSGGCFK